MTSSVINLAALDAPHEEPNFHRVRSEKGQPVKVVTLLFAAGDLGLGE